MRNILIGHEKISTNNEDLTSEQEFCMWRKKKQKKSENQPKLAQKDKPHRFSIFGRFTKKMAWGQIKISSKYLEMELGKKLYMYRAKIVKRILVWKDNAKVIIQIK